MNSLSQNWVQCQFCVNLRLDLSRHVSPQYWSSLLYKPVYFLFCNFRRVFSKQSSGSWWWKKCYVAFARKLMKPWMQRQTAGHADIWTNISSHIPWNVRQIFHEHQISHQTKIKYHNILQQTVNVVLWKISQLLPMNSWIFLFSTIHRHHRNQCHEKFIWISLSSSHTNLISVNHQYQVCFLLAWLQWLKIIVTKAVTTMMKRWPLYADNNDGQ